MPSSSSTSSRGPRIPFEARCVDTRDRFLEALDEFRPDLILSDYTLPRFDGMAALSLARERAPAVPFLIVTGSVNEETAVGCMKAGATDYLLKSNLARIGPAIEAALARVQARAEKARAEEALRRSEANLRAIFNTSLQAFVLVDRRRHHPGAEPHRRGMGRAHPRPRGSREGDRIHDFIPEAAESLRAALGGRGAKRRALPAGADGIERWYETTHAPVVDERGARHRRLPQRPGRERAQAGRAGAPRERGPLPRPVRQRQRPRLHDRRSDGAFLYVNPAWHAGHRAPRDESLASRRLSRPGPSRQPASGICEVVERAEAGRDAGARGPRARSPTAGMPLTLEGNISCTASDGGPPRLRGIYRDVTERKRVEEQLRRAERMQAAGRLAGGVAHEVNNMMTGVIGFSEFLMRSLRCRPIPGGPRSPRSSRPAPARPT